MKVFDKFKKKSPATSQSIGFMSRTGIGKIVFFVVGLSSLIWFLIRVIPKPSRAAYPCMRAAMPVASSFVIYIVSIVASVLAFRKMKLHIAKKQFLPVVLISAFVMVFGLLTVLHTSSLATAGSGVSGFFVDPLGANAPIGQAKGLIPGRVVWVHNPEATNPDCDPDTYGDGYFLSKNCSQDVVNQMVSSALLSLVDAASDEEAWDLIFKHFNSGHNKGNIAYTGGEKIFIKVNSVHAWSTDANGNIKNDKDYGNVDTSPQVVLAVLRQLIEKAKVPQEMIYIGDPFTRMFNHCYNLWSAAFPDVHYLSNSALPGRDTFTKTTTESIRYSDKGEQLGELSDKMVDEVFNADYLINLPALKAHRWAGVTFFAKNHFGSHARGSSSHLHSGLHRVDYDTPLRDEYKSYRVFVDLMASDKLGGKTLLYLMDGLWGTSEEHLPPAKFQSAPFNNHWSSSVFASLDPVAIESVCLDLLQKEFKTEDVNADPPRYTFVQWNAVDDYLHQAASSEWWPEGIVYDPDNTGSPIQSLGVHEHWNNDESMQYSRNLGTGNGIELVKLLNNASSIAYFPASESSLRIYPNPSFGSTNFLLKFSQPCFLTVELYSVSGQKTNSVFSGMLPAGEHTIPFNTGELKPGIYHCRSITAFSDGEIVNSSKLMVE